MGLGIRRSAVAGPLLAALGTLASCAAPPPETPIPPPMQAPIVPQAPAPVVEPAPVPAPVTAAPPSAAFLRTLAGTLPLRQENAPATVASYKSGRQWSSSGTAGRGLLEAWEESDGATRRIAALIFDPASGSIQSVPVETGGRKDSHPAVAGTRSGLAMLVWSSQGSGSDSLLVGQVVSAGGTTGPRWSYRRGTGQVVGTALAGGTDSYIAIWADHRNSGGLTGSAVALTGGQTFLMAQRIALSGDPLGNSTLVSGYQAQPSQPAIAWSGENYLAVWTDARGAASRVFARVLSATGQGTSAEILVAEGAGVDKPAVVWDGQRYMVSWADGRAGQAGARDYFVQAVTRTGGLEGANVPVSAYRMAGATGPSRVVTSGQQVAVFTGQAIDNADSTIVAPASVYASVLTPGATPSTPFSLRAIDGVRLIDAQPWGSGMVVLAEKDSAGTATLDWQYFALAPAGSPGYFGGVNQRNGLQR